MLMILTMNSFGLGFTVLTKLKNSSFAYLKKITVNVSAIQA